MARYMGLPGTVYLTGAGPGSVRLLTVRAVEVFKSAVVVFHDVLVCDEVLAVIPSNAGVYNVGKRCGPKKISQEQIQERIVGAARRGQTVVRLKGGDPLVFGRAQEEIAALRENGIPFEIVPGVTAACAAAAVAEISLTDRKVASKVVFISNHQCAEKGTRRWAETFEDSTLVFYMPGGNLVPLQLELLDNGIDGAMPCLLISQAERAGQEVLCAAVRDLGSLPRVTAPSVLIVGATAAQARADLHLQRCDDAVTLPGDEVILELSERNGNKE